MSIIKSFSVGNGDMFYIDHNSANFSIIDCDLSTSNEDEIIDELIAHQSEINRFISTHPDEDHIRGLRSIADKVGIDNFYCIKNAATKTDPSDDFKKYCELRDDTNKAFYLYKGCSRKWMNKRDDTRGSAGLSILWPDTKNQYFQKELSNIAAAGSPNNSSIIIRYQTDGGLSALWLGDLETDFMINIEDAVQWEQTDIVFAPHHGRKSGKIPKSILDKMNPSIIIIGEAPSDLLNYYSGYNTLTQNSTGTMVLELVEKKIHIHVQNKEYSNNFLSKENDYKNQGLNYIGSLVLD